MKITPPFVLACVAVVLIGCGQKGPLVLPDQQKHKRTIPTLPGAHPKPASGGSTSPTPAPAPAPESPGTPAPPSTPAPDTPPHP